MAALTAGKRAPEINLSLTEAGKNFTLAGALQRGPVLAAFFKVSCPVCQLAFPYLERIHKAYGNKNFTLIGISQDAPVDSISFAKQYGVTFPIAVDPSGKYQVSNAYGLTNVPTLLWISPSGVIELTSAGWDKKDVQRLNQFAAAAARMDQKELFPAGDQAPDFKPG